MTRKREPDAERENLVSTPADKESKFDVVVPEEEEAYDFPEALQILSHSLQL